MYDRIEHEWSQWSKPYPREVIVILAKLNGQTPARKENKMISIRRCLLCGKTETRFVDEGGEPEPAPAS